MSYLTQSIEESMKAGAPAPENTTAERAGIVYSPMHPMVDKTLIDIRLNALRVKYRSARAEVDRMSKWMERNGNGSGRPWGALEAARDSMSDAERVANHWKRILSERGLLSN